MTPSASDGGAHRSNPIGARKVSVASCIARTASLARSVRLRLHFFPQKALARFVESFSSQKEASRVKKVEAVICASSLGAVMQEVDRFDVSGVTLTELAASGQGWKFRGVDRRSKDPADGLHRLRIEVVVLDAYAGPVAWAIARGARAGPSSDPVVSIEIVEDVVRIRTGERGVAAMSSRSDPSQPDEPHDVAHSRGRSFPVLHGVPNRPTIADWTKVLVTNVVLATAVVVLVFHAPVVYAGLGAAGAGLVLWARERRAQTRRAR